MKPVHLVILLLLSQISPCQADDEFESEHPFDDLNTFESDDNQQQNRQELASKEEDHTPPEPAHAEFTDEIEGMIPGLSKEVFDNITKEERDEVKRKEW